tara:strand:- start:109 stop:642 length:534 start_codon:yes stop_codon:yes gene_type:complete
MSVYGATKEGAYNDPSKGGGGFGQGKITGSQMGINTGAWVNSESNRILEADVRAMQNQDQGWSDTEVDAYANKQGTQRAMQANAGITELNRQGLANDVGSGGLEADLTRDISAEASEGGAQDYADADAMSRQQEEARRAETITRMGAQQDVSNTRWQNMQENHAQRAESIMGFFSLL